LYLIETHSWRNLETLDRFQSSFVDDVTKFAVTLIVVHKRAMNQQLLRCGDEASVTLFGFCVHEIFYCDAEACSDLDDSAPGIVGDENVAAIGGDAFDATLMV